MTNGIVNATGLEGQFASLGINGTKSAYVPPHMRSQQRAASTPAVVPINGTGWNDSRSSTPSRGGGYGGGRGGFDRGADRGGYSAGPRGGATGGGWSGERSASTNGWYGTATRVDGQPRDTYGFGVWKDGVHLPGGRNARLEKELFGDVNDPSKQHTGINFEKYDDIPVEATGAGVPDPIIQFTNPPLDPVLLENIGYAHYNTPTPVQKYSIPIVAAGRDLMACAQTGSGKTGGFLFPILSASFANGPRAPPADAQGGGFRTRKAYPTALILAPTRELVSQIHEEARKFCYRSWVRPAVVYGGADINQQLRQIERGCDLLSATPGRLVDLIERGRISLANIRYLVLDEADRMLDMGFEPQIRRIVQGEDMPGVQDRQTLMFSATFPRDIQMLARDFMKDYVFLSVGRVGSTSENITQKVERKPASRSSSWRPSAWQTCSPTSCTRTALRRHLFTVTVHNANVKPLCRPSVQDARLCWSQLPSPLVVSIFPMLRMSSTTIFHLTLMTTFIVLVVPAVRVTPVSRPHSSTVAIATSYVTCSSC
ncbi:unnamed protein product [Somion occarium]|uniref:RNA helicase n=1 Tax=Somion occarium TaxID=3059160 RepID=A0ABP1E5F9_9APHY